MTFSFLISIDRCCTFFAVLNNHFNPTHTQAVLLEFPVPIYSYFKLSCAQCTLNLCQVHYTYIHISCTNVLVKWFNDDQNTTQIANNGVWTLRSLSNWSYIYCYLVIITDAHLFKWILIVFSCSMCSLSIRKIEKWCRWRIYDMNYT